MNLSSLSYKTIFRIWYLKGKLHSSAQALMSINYYFFHPKLVLFPQPCGAGGVLTAGPLVCHLFEQPRIERTSN